MNNAIYSFREPKNEPVLTYMPGSSERKLLEEELSLQSSSVAEIPLIIGGKEIRTGITGKVVKPTDHGHILATYHMATEKEVMLAIEAALEAKKKWMTLAWMERASVMIRAAELLSKKYRFVINASTMLGQGKNACQAEIDAACEVIDEASFDKIMAYIRKAGSSPDAEIIAGAIFSNDKYATMRACRALRYSAGNYYINDKPTGAMVGQQPFGGARASGTNDKAGSHLNLLRWVSPRTIKETLIPAADYRYPYME
ncbi:MAG: aldehyde dehydrogenase family protein [Bacteroidales bacterium]|nr:aldehyde dehydrogenase family protein [Bacteroidales bacterium]